MPRFPKTFKPGRPPYAIRADSWDMINADEAQNKSQGGDNQEGQDTRDPNVQADDAVAQGSSDVPGGPPQVGDGVQDQILNILPDQPIRLVITSGESTQAKGKKEHPQDRIDKFWANFEPEYLGGVTQILPDPVSSATTSTSKKKIPEDNSPKVLNSYENARNTCVKNVTRIIRECRSMNQKYTDPHFDIERDLKVTGNRDCLYGLTNNDGSQNPGDVKRVTDVYENPQFFKDGAGFDDIVQGSLGDCWLLAGLSAITANEDLLNRVCVKHDQDVGVYGFVFHRDGEWFPCIIDDKLYLRAPSFDESGETLLERYGVKQKDQERLYVETLQKGSKALYFASCRDDNETWVPLLEKALAKAHGDYMSLDGGQVGEALEDLTGGVTTEIYTTNILNKNEFWKDLQRIGKDFIFSCHVSVFSGWLGSGDSYESEERDKRLRGIHELHAYSVLTTYEGHGERLVKIRNPWGSSEWTGPWSDGSEQWTGEWLERLKHKFGDDGVFWMTYDDMLKKYKYMDRTRLFGDDWHIAQEWVGVQVPWNSRDYQQTKFTIDVPEDTETVIVLSQLDERYFIGFEGQYYFTLSFRVQNDEEDEDDYIVRSAVNYELSRSTNVEVNLEKGKYTVLFKIEASKNDNEDIEKIIRQNIERKEKITQMATLYDLAHRKGRLPKKEEPKKEEAKETPKTADTASNTQTDQTKTEKKDGDEEKTEKKGESAEKTEKKDESQEKTEKQGEKKDEKSGDKTEAKKDEKLEEKSDDKANDKKEEQTEKQEKPVQDGSNNNVSSAAQPQAETGSSGQAQKPVPDDSDPNRNPWNASCVVGLRVYSKVPGLKLEVVRPSDEGTAENSGVTLDRDDVAKGALEAAEKANTNQSATEAVKEDEKKDESKQEESSDKKTDEKSAQEKEKTESSSKEQQKSEEKKDEGAGAKSGEDAKPADSTTPPATKEEGAEAQVPKEAEKKVEEDSKAAVDGEAVTASKTETEAETKDQTLETAKEEAKAE